MTAASDDFAEFISRNRRRLPLPAIMVKISRYGVIDERRHGIVGLMARLCWRGGGCAEGDAFTLYKRRVNAPRRRRHPRLQPHAGCYCSLLRASLASARLRECRRQRQ